jgi:NAD-dependent SIR2 family protein deacetylase
VASSWTSDITARRFPALVEELKSGDVTLFAGAGLSSNAGLPLWGELMLPLANELGLDPDTDPINIAQYYSEAHVQGRYLLNKHIVRELRSVQPKFSFIHMLIKELPLKAIITTNFDNLIERALARDPERPHRVIVSDEDLSYHSDRDLPLIKANGCVTRPESLVLTAQDFESYAERRPVLTGYLKYLMATSTLLFVGTSLRDPAFDAFNAEVLRHLSQHRRAFYSIVSNTNKYQAQDFRERGIELIDLEAQRDEIGDSLTEFLESLVRLVRPRPMNVQEPAERDSSYLNLMNSRLGSGLSLQVDPDRVDRIHRYSLVERTDLLDYASGDFVSVRRLSGTNESDLLSAHVVYSESSERKLTFADVRVTAFDSLTREPLIIEPLDDRDLAMFTHGYKILFRQPLSPGERFDIVYSITLRGELLDLSPVNEIMSVSLARITRDVEKLRFNVCLNFRPKMIRLECFDEQGSRVPRQGAAPRVSPFDPAEWYEELFDIAWSAEPTVIQWECLRPAGALYIVNYHA